MSVVSDTLKHMSELQKQFDFYRAHQDEIVSEHQGRWVVISGEKVVRAFDSEADAYQFATAELKPGTFLIQCVAPGEESYTQTFHSRVAI